MTPISRSSAGIIIGAKAGGMTATISTLRWSLARSALVPERMPPSM